MVFIKIRDIDCVVISVSVKSPNEEVGYTIYNENYNGNPNWNNEDINIVRQSEDIHVTTESEGIYE